MYLFFFFFFIIWTLMGYFCSQTADRRGRNPDLWFFLGAALGIIAVIILFILPVKRVTAPSIEVNSIKGRPAPSFVPSEDVAKAPPKPLWYYLDEEERQYGPMSFHALREAWEEEKISTKTYLWNETMNDWQTLDSLPGLLEDLT